MAFPVGTALSVQGFTIVVGATLGPSAVVIFSATRTITRVPLQVVGTIHNSVWPELSRSVGGGRMVEAQSILRHSVQLAVASLVPMLLGLALFGAAIIQWWTKGFVDPSVQLIYILLFVVAANSFWYMMSSALVATNRHRRLAAIYIVGTTAALLAALPLSNGYGPAGAAAALLVADIPMVAYVFPEALRVIDDRPTAFLRAVLDVRGGLRSAISSVKVAP